LPIIYPDLRLDYKVATHPLDLQRDAEIVVKSQADQLEKGIQDEKKRMSDEEQRLNDVVSQDSKIHERFAALDANISKYEEIGQKYERIQAALKEQAKQLTSLNSTVTDLAAGFVPLPKPTAAPPFHLKLGEVIPPEASAKLQKAGKIVFQITGNTGGTKPKPQLLVAQRMEADFANDAPDKPAFLYLLGNIVYFHGEADKYYDQFYEPYGHYPAPIFAIPGNHDGDQLPSASGPPLEGFMRNFCASGQTVLPDSKDAPRMAMTQPYCYWTLETPYATVIGLYTNVPTGGAIDSEQQKWLTTELRSAPEDKALLVCLHHSIYSFDEQQSGSARMGDALAYSINESRRIPNIIFSSYANNYQRIDARVGETVIGVVNIGIGGYPALKRMANTTPGTTDPSNGAQLKAFDDSMHGYLTLTIDEKTISGILTLVDQDSGASSAGDTYTYTAKPLHVKEGQSVSF
jgi:hypothetical protein